MKNAGLVILLGQEHGEDEQAPERGKLFTNRAVTARPAARHRLASTAEKLGWFNVVRVVVHHAVGDYQERHHNFVPSSWAAGERADVSTAWN